jgi:hypothetical protein
MDGATPSEQSLEPDNPLNPDLPTSGKAVWNADETKALIDFLLKKHAAGGEGGFKATVFRKAALAIASERTAGGPKDGKCCGSKYAGVHTFCPTFYFPLTFILA